MSDLAPNQSDGLDTVKSRLIRFLKEKRMSQTEFARLMGVSPTYIGAMRRSISEVRLKKLLELFPDLNRDWILFGEGEMFIEPEEGPDLTEGYVVPLIPVKAFAGNLQLWAEGVELRDCEKVVSPVKGVDFAIRIAGNSMEPEFQNGSMLFIKRINDRAFIPWGNPMVIDTENGVLVKAVYPCDSEPGEEQYIEARSYNPNYPPFKIPVESIYSLYRIISAIKQYSTM
ncbi:MAG: helix-turn-helix domain-containing protein [Muribaculaceae bacterium]|nr:helix-turn-helix domain-containing protein [Muribaculaceae bacterium]